jgi:hypothetical protein
MKRIFLLFFIFAISSLESATRDLKQAYVPFQKPVPVKASGR